MKRESQSWHARASVLALATAAAMAVLLCGWLIATGASNSFVSSAPEDRAAVNDSARPPDTTVVHAAPLQPMVFDRSSAIVASLAARQPKPKQTP